MMDCAETSHPQRKSPRACFLHWSKGLWHPVSDKGAPLPASRFKSIELHSTKTESSSTMITCWILVLLPFLSILIVLLSSSRPPKPKLTGPLSVLEFFGRKSKNDTDMLDNSVHGMMQHITSLVGSHETADVLASLIRQDGAGSWPHGRTMT